MAKKMFLLFLQPMICWLPKSDNSANATELDIAVGPPTILQKPYSLTSTSNLEFSTTTTTTNDILPPTPDKRLVYGSKVYKHSDIQLPKVLYCIDEDVLF